MNLVKRWAVGMLARLSRPGGAQRLAAAMWPHLALIAAVVALVLWKAHDGTWPLTHEGFRYIALAEHFRLAFESGQWWPRWLPEINGGHGYPTFVYYQALLFFLFVPFRWLTGDAVTAMWVTTAATLALGAIGSYKLCAQRDSQLYGLFGGLLFLLTPYVYVEWLMRGDLSELLALCLVPWSLHFLRVVIERSADGEPSAAPLAGFAVATAAVLLAHPITGLLLAPSLALIALAATLRGLPIDWRLLGRIALGGIAAVALTTPYWQPLVSLRGAVNLDAAFSDYFDPVKHTVHWEQLFGGPWGFTGSSAGNARDGMSFELGRLQLAAALTGAVIAWKTPFVRGATLALLLSIAIMTPDLERVWTWPVLAQMQFPWRMLSVIAGLQVALAAGWARKVAAFDTPAGRGRLALLLGLLLLAAGWRPEQFTLRSKKPTASAEVRRLVDGARHHGENFAARNEFLPLTARQPPRTPRGDGPLVTAEPPAGVDLRFPAGHGSHHIAVEVRAAAAVQVVIDQLYFPGWQVKLDGRALPRSTLESALGPDGRIRVPIEAGGPRLIQARYAGPPGAAVRWAGVLLALALLGGVALSERRRSPEPAPAAG